MTDFIKKAELLHKIQTGYQEFEEILETLNPEDMLLPNVNSYYSVKDNLAHLTIWQDYLVGGLPDDTILYNGHEYTAGPSRCRSS